MHRLGALLTLFVVSSLAIVILIKERNRLLLNTASVLLFLLTVQIALGISNVLLYLPLPLAVAHNAGAALLLLTLVFLNYLVTPPETVGDRHE